MLYKDFSGRLKPRTFWLSSELGTMWAHRPKPLKKKSRLTEAEDNAIGRRIRRRINRLARAWRPFAKR
jgi:hypothetical protein